ICGSNDPYLNFDLVNSSLDSLPEGSTLEVIEGGAHVIMYEKPYYQEFQKKLIAFLNQ
ncbi:MAG TPA: alpha/beta hydrolase, partial [Ruminococcaceae bacterium]|nr:alpha/beta hydrolase [Oscillospiraceae bacterium]